jgi:hypothetical protein
MEQSIDRRAPACIPRKVMKGGSHLCAPNYCRRYWPAARMAQPIDTSTQPPGIPPDPSRTQSQQAKRNPLASKVLHGPKTPAIAFGDAFARMQVRPVGHGRLLL